MERYVSFIAIWVFLSTAFVRSQRMLNTGIYKRSFFNGPGGECEVFRAKTRKRARLSGEIICSKGWTRNGTVTFDKEVLQFRRACKYYKKISMQLCYGTTLGKNGPVTCFKNVTSYFMTSFCSGYWLNWERCSAPCGGGVRARVRITQVQLRFARVTDYSSCNMHSCPTWGPWKPVLDSNATTACNIITCTRTLQRDCVYRKSSASPSLCAGEYQYNRTSEYHNFTLKEVPCAPEECAVTESFTDAPTAHLTNSIFVDGNVSAFGPLATFEKEVSVACRQRENVWIGVGIGFIVACIMSALSYLIFKHCKKRMTVRKPNTKKNERDRVGCLYSRRTIVASGEYLQHDTQPIASPPLPGQQRHPVQGEEPTYCMVLGQSHNVSKTEQNTSNRMLRKSYPNATDHTSSEGDPLYSHIPAFQSHKQLPYGDRYSSSEFDSCEESDEDRKSSQSTGSLSERGVTTSNLAPNQTKDDGCKSVDSDEDRDEVHTLRKPSIKLKRKRSSKRLESEEVFLPEDEDFSEDPNNERKSDFNVRYSKLLAKRTKPPRRSSEALGYQHSDSGFHWFEGGRRSSENSDCSNHPTQRDSIMECSGHQRLSCRHSSGASSVASFNVDVITSGYNSALGESTDEERSVWSGRGTSFRSSVLPYERQFNRRRHQTLKANWQGNLPAERWLRSTQVATRTSSSLFNPRISSLNETDYYCKREFEQRPSRAARPAYERSQSLMSDLGRRNLVEDVYSSPVDAEVQDTKEPVYTEYNVPYDAIDGKSVKSFTQPRRSKNLHMNVPEA